MERKSSVLASIVILGIGVVLVCVYGQQDLLRWIISLVGATFILAAFIGMVGQMLADRRERHRALDENQPRRGRVRSLFNWITYIAAMILGVVFIILWAEFEQGFTFVMGALVLVGGIYHFYMLALGNRGTHFPFWFYLLPTVMVVGGGALLFYKPDNGVLAMATGIGMIVFAVTTILEVTYASMDTKSDAGDAGSASADNESTEADKPKTDYYADEDDGTHTEARADADKKSDHYTQDVDPE